MFLGAADDSAGSEEGKLSPTFIASDFSPTNSLFASYYAMTVTFLHRK